MTPDRRPSPLPAFLELAGACLVVFGIVLVSLPLGLIATGALLVLSAVALEREGATERPRSRAG
ncbi:MAG TPA: hypothetical protein VHL53_19510 [Acidimicrobiia bacterium]|nr:hypothetical protein [Acidimicrobiia bacterium]